MQTQSVRRDTLTLLYIHIYTYKLYFNRTAAPMRKQKADFVNPQSCVCCAVQKYEETISVYLPPFQYVLWEDVTDTTNSPASRRSNSNEWHIAFFVQMLLHLCKKCILVSLIIINIWKKQLHSLSVFNKEGEAFNESQHKTIHALGGVGRGWEWNRKHFLCVACFQWPRKKTIF